MKIRKTLAAAAAALMATAPAAAQDLRPETRIGVTPVAPPAMVVTPIAPNTFGVTAVPGAAVATTVKIQRFSDYDRDSDGVYNPTEFAHALYFLSTGAAAPGNRALPRADHTMHKGAPLPMKPQQVVTLLNMTSGAFGRTDRDDDMRVSPTELQAVALM